MSHPVPHEHDPLLELSQQTERNWIGVNVPYPPKFRGYGADGIRRQVGHRAVQTVIDGCEVGVGGDSPHITLLYGFDEKHHAQVARLVQEAALRASDITYTPPYQTRPKHLGGSTIILCADVVVTPKLEKLLESIYAMCGMRSHIPLHLTMGKWEGCLPVTTLDDEVAACLRIALIAVVVTVWLYFWWSNTSHY